MSSVWDQLDAPTRAPLDRFGGEGVVALWPSLVRTLRGHGNSAILLAQLLYLSRRLGDDEGWSYQAQRRLEAQTGLGPDAQRKAVQLLVRLGVLDIARRGVPARLFYRLNLPRLAALLLQHGKGALVAGHSLKLDAEHPLKLDPEYGLEQAVNHGPPPAAGHGSHHRKIMKDNIHETKEKISPAPPQGAGTPPKKPDRQSTPTHPLPDDFTVTAAMRTWAAERTPAVDLKLETEKLVMWARKGRVAQRLGRHVATLDAERGETRAAGPAACVFFRRAARQHPHTAQPKAGG